MRPTTLLAIAAGENSYFIYFFITTIVSNAQDDLLEKAGEARAFIDDKRGGARVFSHEEKRGGARVFFEDKKGGARAFHDIEEPFTDYKRGGARAFMNTDGDGIRTFYEKRGGARAFFDNKRGGARGFSDLLQGGLPTYLIDKRGGARMFIGNTKRHYMDEYPTWIDYAEELEDSPFDVERRAGGRAFRISGGVAVQQVQNDKRGGGRSFPVSDESKEKRY
uniref:WG repeat-containing protein n=1 Tax=Heterorhabditis bacteriophora TaxID=37862 RepID=A0A1I7WXY6_HETBA